MKNTANSGFGVKKLLPLLVLILLGTGLFIIGRHFSAKAYDFYGDGLPTENSEKLFALRMHEKQVLNSYAVIDSQRSRYRIPIAVAMERYSQKNIHK